MLNGVRPVHLLRVWVSEGLTICMCGLGLGWEFSCPSNFIGSLPESLTQELLVGGLCVGHYAQIHATSVHSTIMASYIVQVTHTCDITPRYHFATSVIQCSAYIILYCIVPYIMRCTNHNMTIYCVNVYTHIIV